MLKVTTSERQSFRFRGLRSRRLAGAPLLGGLKTFYHRGPKSLSAALTTTVNTLCGCLLQRSTLVSTVAPMYIDGCKHALKSVVKTIVLFKSFTRSS